MRLELPRGVGAFYTSNRVAQLPFYSRIFNSAEVDSSFYRAPSKPMVAGWIRATGRDFKFSLDSQVRDARQCLEWPGKEFLKFVDLVEPIAGPVNTNIVAPIMPAIPSRCP
jgi:hypothetical protein